MIDQPTLSPPPGVSGKRVTLFVLLALAMIGISLSYTLWTYNRLDDARKQTADAWRGLSDQLIIRYRAAEKAIARGVDRREMKMEFGEKFQLAVDGFRTTSLPQQQHIAARRVEGLLHSDDFHVPQAQPLEVPPELQVAVDDYNLRLDQERKLLRSLGGRILDIFLKFAEPVPFELAD